MTIVIKGGIAVTADGQRQADVRIDGETIAHMSTHDWLQRMIAEAEANRLAISDERTST